MAKKKVYEEDFKKMIVELYENKKPICEIKREFDLSAPKDVPDEVIIRNNKIDLNSNNVLVDFINTRKYFSYERDENGKLNKVLRNGLRIRVEYDIT